jgi:hypothetical protein
MSSSSCRRTSYVPPPICFWPAVVSDTAGVPLEYSDGALEPTPGTNVAVLLDAGPC